MEVASLLNASIVSGGEQKLFRPCFSWTRGRLSEMIEVLLQWFCYWKQTYNGFCASIHHDVLRPLLMFAFQYLKANFTKICKEISFLSFFRKMLMSAFLLTFKANYLEQMPGYSSFSLIWFDSLILIWIPIALSKIYFFRVVLTWRKNLGIE